MTVAEVAARSGFAPSALRYYEREGLIAAIRTSGNQRRYERIVLRRLAFVRAARNVGLTLDEVRAELAQLPVRANADNRRLAPHLPQLARAIGREDRGDRGSAGPIGQLHRLRLSLAEDLRAVQPGGPTWRAGPAAGCRTIAGTVAATGGRRGLDTGMNPHE